MAEKLIKESPAQIALGKKRLKASMDKINADPTANDGLVKVWEVATGKKTYKENFGA